MSTTPDPGFWDDQVARLLAGHREPVVDADRLRATGESLAQRLEAERTAEANLGTLLQHYAEPPIDPVRLEALGGRLAGRLHAEGQDPAREPSRPAIPAAGRTRRSRTRISRRLFSPEGPTWLGAAAAAGILVALAAAWSVSRRPVADPAPAPVAEPVAVAVGPVVPGPAPTAPRETGGTGAEAEPPRPPSAPPPVVPEPLPATSSRGTPSETPAAPPPPVPAPVPLPLAPPSLAPPDRPTAPVVASVESVSGEVRVLTGPSRAPASPGSGLVGGQGIETVGAASRAEVRLTDGTRLELGGDTSLASIAEETAGRRLRLDGGALAAEVVRQAPGRGLVFATPHAEARVLGTRLALSVSADATRLEVREGRVRLTRLPDRAGADVGPGQFAVAAKGPAPFARTIPAPAAASPPGWSDVFAGTDLAGWRATRGRWRVEDGTVVGEDPGGAVARIESERAWGDFELACRIRVGGTRLAEFQVHGYALFAQLTIESPSAWRELKVVSRGPSLQATLDGRKVPIEPGEGGDVNAPGAIAFYVSRGGRIEIRDARIRDLARD